MTIEHEADDNDWTQAKGAWPKTLVELVDVVDAYFKRMGDRPADARKRADGVVQELAQYFGGRQMYLPNGWKLKIALRNIGIWKDYDGTNVRELSMKHGLSEMQIYNIIKQQRELLKQLRGAVIANDRS